MSGIGSKGHETANHLAAMKDAERQGYLEAGTYAAAVKELWQRDPARAERLGLKRPTEEIKPK
jgi:hypothetical protein